MIKIFLIYLDIVKEINMYNKLNEHIQKIEIIGKYSFSFLVWLKELERLIQDAGIGNHKKELSNLLSNYEMEIAVSRCSLEYINKNYIKLVKDFLFILKSDLNIAIEKNIIIEQKPRRFQTYFIILCVIVVFIVIFLNINWLV